MTIVVRGEDNVLDQIIKQLDKLIDVIEVHDFREGEYVDRELVLLRVSVDRQTRAEVMQICDIFRAKIIDVQPKRLAIEITGNESKIEKFISLMEAFGIIDLTRTGQRRPARVNDVPTNREVRRLQLFPISTHQPNTQLHARENLH